MKKTSIIVCYGKHYIRYFEYIILICRTTLWDGFDVSISHMRKRGGGVRQIK